MRCSFLNLVEVTGLEPTTSWSLTKRATKLRYTSMYVAFSCLSVYDLFFSTAQGKRRLSQPIARIYVQSYSSHCAHTPQARCAERNAHPEPSDESKLRYTSIKAYIIIGKFRKAVKRFFFVLRIFSYEKIPPLRTASSMRFVNLLFRDFPFFAATL